MTNEPSAVKSVSQDLPTPNKAGRTLKVASRCGIWGLAITALGFFSPIMGGSFGIPFKVIGAGMLMCGAGIAVTSALLWRQLPRRWGLAGVTAAVGVPLGVMIASLGVMRIFPSEFFFNVTRALTPLMVVGGASFVVLLVGALITAWTGSGTESQTG